jgi:hypothetical protein
MKRIAVLAAMAASLLVVPAAVAEPLSPGCFLTGGGTVDGESFGGQAGSFQDGSIDGTWTHVTSDGHLITTDVDTLDCQKNGGEPAPPAVDFSIARVTGTSTWDGEPGYIVAVQVQDYGEPGTGGDMYRIVLADEGGNVLYTSAGILDGGNIQIVSTNGGRP